MEDGRGGGARSLIHPSLACLLGREERFAWETTTLSHIRKGEGGKVADFLLLFSFESRLLLSPI